MKVTTQMSEAPMLVSPFEKLIWPVVSNDSRSRPLISALISPHNRSLLAIVILRFAAQHANAGVSTTRNQLCSYARLLQGLYLDEQRYHRILEVVLLSTSKPSILPHASHISFFSAAIHPSYGLTLAVAVCFCCAIKGQHS